MATTKREFVFATFVLACIALVQIIVAFSTEMWVFSDLDVKPSINYFSGTMNAGVFKGTLTRASVASSLTVVCDFGENVCMWSCMKTAKGRQRDLENLLNGKFSGVCASDPSSFTDIPSNKEALMNAGAWLSAVVALTLSLIATTGSAFLGVLNTATNPTKTWLAMDSLLFWNGAAALLDLMALILLGVIFGSTLESTVSIDSVIAEVHSSSASLGWSYWLLVDPPLLHLINVGLLVYRDWSIAREPEPYVYDPEKEVADGTIFLY